MKKIILLAVIMAPVITSCNDNGTGKGDHFTFSVSKAEIEFLDGITPPQVVEILSGNGEYTYKVEDENIVAVEQLTQGYHIGAFRFTPKALGITTVTLTDVNGADFIRVPVSISTPAVKISGMKCSVNIVMEDDTPENYALVPEIDADVMANLTFKKGYSYVMSNEKTGLMYCYQGTTFREIRTFEHKNVDDSPYMLLKGPDADGDGTADYLKELRVVKDATGITHSYSSFFGISIPDGNSMTISPADGGTRNEAEVLPEVWFLEELTQIYKNQPRYLEVESVIVLFMLEYGFTAFKERD